MKTKLLWFVPLLLVSTLAWGAPDDLWLHVFVQEAGEDGETVRVNVPLSLVESILPLIETDEMQQGRIRVVDEFEAEGIDIRKMWQELRNTKDGDYVTVQGKGESVRVGKSGDYFTVDVDEGEQKVRVRLPLDVVDALFSAGEDELDLVAAIRALGRHQGEDMVVVEGGSEVVRIWIDNRQEGRR